MEEEDAEDEEASDEERVSTMGPCSSTTTKPPTNQRLILKALTTITDLAASMRESAPKPSTSSTQHRTIFQEALHTAFPNINMGDLKIKMTYPSSSSR